MKFLLASLKTLTNSKCCSESRIKFLFRLLRSHWSIPFVQSSKGAGGYPKTGTSSLKRVTGRDFTINK
jgi:hypothetical protein